jgi:DNA methylase
VTSRLQDLAYSWQGSSAGTENSLHQLAPYIGKLKTSIASSLITSFSKKGDIVLDPFAGSGVVPLEALLLGRGTVANDFSPYASVLTRAKLFPIRESGAAIQLASHYVRRAKARARQQRYRVSAPVWVRKFFHPRTLAETKVLSDLLLEERQWFLLANLLGILHHQRPGFLSFPSSHLVPYLRSRKFPRAKFPELYGYRDVEPRLIRKLERSYRRYIPFDPQLMRRFTAWDVRRYRCPVPADIAITSPPYMNALDYGRDNRLRLWLLGKANSLLIDRLVPRTTQTFSELMRKTSLMLTQALRAKGRAILIVGESRRHERLLRADVIVRSAFESQMGNWRLVDLLRDPVPDIRRSRRGYSATKAEWIMVFERR